MIWVKSFQGEEVTRVAMDDSLTSSYSPTQASLVSQDRVEESLYHSLAHYEAAEVQFLKEFISFKEDEAGITARIINQTNNQEELVRTQYLVAADGAHSRIRKLLNITMEGSDNLSQSCSVYCEIALSILIKNGISISALDLFEKDFVLLIGSEGELWRTAVIELAQTISFPFTIYKVGVDGELTDPENGGHDVYGMTTKGAVLVRPDGHVTWRS
jgi:hypothetical protein